MLKPSSAQTAIFFYQYNCESYSIYWKSPSTSHFYYNIPSKMEYRWLPKWHHSLLATWSLKAQISFVALHLPSFPAVPHRVIWHPSSHISLRQLQRAMLCFSMPHAVRKCPAPQMGLVLWFYVSNIFEHFFRWRSCFQSSTPEPKVSPLKKNLKKRRIQGKRILVLVGSPTAHVPLQNLPLSPPAALVLIL